eukprot:COSAG01_NODE_56936_length_315_cov_0.944444_1_plen_45_part_01
MPELLGAIQDQATFLLEEHTQRDELLGIHKVFTAHPSDMMIAFRN